MKFSPEENKENYSKENNEIDPEENK